MSPTLPAPTVPLAPLTPSVTHASMAQYSARPTPPGWYPSPSGAMQWWDGTRWGPLAPPVTVTVRAIKETGIAYLFFFLLGGFSAHRFYLGLTSSAITFNVVWWLGWILSPFLIGVPLVIAGAIWLVVDLFLIPSLVRSVNAGRGYFS